MGRSPVYLHEQSRSERLSPGFRRLSPRGMHHSPPFRRGGRRGMKGGKRGMKVGEGGMEGGERGMPQRKAVAKRSPFAQGFPRGEWDAGDGEWEREGGERSSPGRNGPPVPARDTFLTYIGAGDSGCGIMPDRHGPGSASATPLLPAQGA